MHRKGENVKRILAKKWISRLLIVAVLVTYMPVSFLDSGVAWADSSWDGASMSDELSVDASTGAYLISSPEDLAKFASLVNDEGETSIDGILTKCIDLGEYEWIPIGAWGTVYEGNFDGAGHTIKGLSIFNDNGCEAIGLFGMVSGGEIKNLTVEGYITDFYDIYAFAGGIAGYAIDETFTKVSSKVTIEMDGTGALYAGGIAGVSEGAVTFEQCANHNSVYGYDATGGITGFLSSCSELNIIDCYNNGAVQCDTDLSNAGGFIGYGDVSALNFDGYCYSGGAVFDGDGYAAFGVAECEEFNNNCFYLYINDGVSTFDPFDYFTKYDITSDKDVFLDDGFNEAFGMSGENVLLNWEIQALNHEDEKGATDEQKQEALAVLDTYKSKDNYYDEQWAEIQSIITATKTKAMADSSLTMSAIENMITAAKIEIDAVQDKTIVDTISGGKKKVNDKFASLKSEDYDEEEWKTIKTIANKALSDIDAAEVDDVNSIAEKAVKDMEAVMTKADKAALNENRQNALSEVALYIKEIEAQWQADLLLLKDNEQAYNALKAREDKLKETYFAPYLTGGKKADEVLEMTQKSDLEKWVQDAKADCDKYRNKGKITKISTADELMAFAELVNSKGSDNTYSNLDAIAILTADIDVSDKAWTPMGTSRDYPYTGMFFGQGHTVNIISEKTNNANNGMFGVVAGAYIEGLTVTGKISNNVSGSTKAGAAGIVGYVYSKKTGETDTTIVNCKNEADISGYNNIGGIVGYVSGVSSSAKTKLTIKNCENNGKITAKGSYTGGIVGNGYDSIEVVHIENCNNYNSVETKGSSGAYVGGILGYSKSPININNCSNTANISVLEAKSSNSSYGIGGIAGYVNATGVIQCCDNAGNLLAAQYIGGIIGRAGDTYVLDINLCSNEGNITSNKGSSTAGNEKYYGGIVGYGIGNITYCYNSGDIDATVSSDTYAYLGGIIGCFSGGYNKDVSMLHVYNTGNFKTNPKRTDVRVGGIAALISGTTYKSIEIDYCYTEKECADTAIHTTRAEVGENIGTKTLDEIKSQDFINHINAGHNYFVPSEMELNDGCPVFQWQIDKVKTQLAAKKEEAKNDLTSKYNPDDYYSPQKESVAQVLAEAISQIDAISNSLSSVGITKTEYAQKLDTLMNKLQVQSKLIEEKEKACQQLDEYLDFSGYNDATKVTLEKIKSNLETTVTSGKSDINSISPETYAADFDIVSKKLAEYEALIDTLYMTKGVWNGNTVDNDYAPPKVDGVWQIENSVQLAWLSQQVNGKTGISQAAKLCADIDLGNNEWVPIGITSTSYYSRTFDGNNHTVTGMYVDANDSAKFNYGGLFGMTGPDAVIKNLTVEGKIEGTSPYTWGRYFGGIVGMSQGKIFNCTSKVDIATDKNEDYVGGVAGNARHLAYCTNQGNITAKGNYTGGITGFLASTGIAYFCVNNGTVSGGRYAGGIAGELDAGSNSGAIVSHCYNKGDISSESIGFNGGIAGNISGINEKIANCYNTGKATAGIIGLMGTTGTAGDKQTENGAVISNTYNIGETTANIVNMFYHGSVQNSYGLKGTPISAVTSDKGYTSISNSLTLEEKVLKGYAQTLGDAFTDDKANVNGGYPVLTFENDSQEVKEAKIESFDSMITLVSNLYYTGKYGSQAPKLYDAAYMAQYDVANASTLEEVEAAKESGIAKIKAVKTELQLTQDTVIANFENVLKENVYSKSNEEAIETLIKEATDAVNACKKIADVGTTEKSYMDKLTVFSTYTEDTKAELKETKDNFIAENKLSAAKTKEMESLAYEAEKSIDNVAQQKKDGKIDSAAARAKMDDIFSETKKSLSDAAKTDGVLPDVKVSEDDELKAAKEAAYSEILEAVSTGLDKDYREEQWKEVVKTLEDAAQKLEKAATEAEIEEVKSKAVETLKKIPTELELSSEESKLQHKKETSKNSIASVLEDINMLAEAEKQEALDIINKANSDIDQVSLKNNTLDSAIQQVEDICAKALKDLQEKIDGLKGSYWYDDIKEPTEVEGVYQISTAEELAWFAADVNSGNGKINAVLLNDIDLAGKMWVPIGEGFTGEATYCFQGIFDGAGHTIKNMYVADNQGPIGLFGKLKNAEIKNLTVDGIVTSAGNSSANYKAYAGGIAGYAVDSSIINCVNEATIKSAVEYPKDGSSLQILNVGGILGAAENKVFIEKCVNKGNIDAEYCKAIGGILGESLASGSNGPSLSQCANFGNIRYEEKYTPTGNVKASCGAGGIIGIVSKDDTDISYCYNAGDIKGVENVGGIVGYVTTSYYDECLIVKNSYNCGKISASTAFCGAIAGSAMSGEFLDKVYMLDKSAAKSIGYIILENDIKTISSDKLMGEEIVKSLNGDDAVFMKSIAEVNNGYPIFTWQLVDKDIKAQIISYIEAYLDEGDFTDVQWNEVTKILESAAENIKSASTSVDVVKSFDDAIASLNSVSAELKEAIVGLFKEVVTDDYDASLKKAVDDLIKKARENILKDDITAKDAQALYNQARADTVDLVIDNIDKEIVFESEKSINQAEAAYDLLTKEQAELVSKYIKFAKAKNEYIENTEKAKEVTELIKAIGAVDKSKEEKIAEAKTAFDKLTAAQKTFLEDGIAELLKEAEETFEKDSKAANKTINLINVIGTVTKNSGAVITAARTSYNSLTDAQKTYITDQQLATLVNAEKKFADISSEKPNNSENPNGEAGSHLGTQVGWNTQTGASSLGYAEQSGLGQEAAKDDTSLKNDVKSDVSDGLVEFEPSDDSTQSADFDWSIVLIAIGIVALVAAAYGMFMWFGAANKRKKN